MEPSHVTLDARIRVPEHVVSRGFGEDVVLLNLDTGQYHGVNGSGKDMLDALSREASLREVAHDLAATYEMPVEHMEADVLEFVTQLLERGLVVVQRGDADG